MIENLPQGVIWAFMDVGDPATVYINVVNEPVPEGDWGANVDPLDEEEMGRLAFLHLFGVVPEPGQALKLQAAVWEFHCPLCGMPINQCGTPYCRRCEKDVDWTERHARILEVKSLEEVKP